MATKKQTARDLVDEARQCIALSGNNFLARVPRLIADILDTEAWRVLKYKSFTSFALARDGLGLSDDRGAAHLQRLLMDGGYVAEWVEILDVIAISRVKPRKPLPGVAPFLKLGTGNDVNRLLLRLYRERDDLYQRVLTGELSVMAAAVEAGWRKVAREGQIKRVTAEVVVGRDVRQVVRAVREVTKERNTEAATSVVEAIWSGLSPDVRRLFVLRNIPGGDADAAARSVHIDIDDPRMIEG